MSKTTFFALTGLALALTACGPSFQAIYEGNVRFEHCYALEENPQRPLPDKALCWRDWSEHYTFGQTRDRVQYAISRYSALSNMSLAPTDEAMMMGAPGETARTSTISAPAPSSAWAPPPKTLDSGETKNASQPGDMKLDVPYIDAGAPTTATVTVTPNQSCLDGCSGDFRSCATSCEGDAGLAAKACTTCKKKYASCGRACFK